MKVSNFNNIIINKLGERSERSVFVIANYPFLTQTIKNGKKQKIHKRCQQNVLQQNQIKVNYCELTINMMQQYNGVPQYHADFIECRVYLIPQNLQFYTSDSMIFSIANNGAQSQKMIRLRTLDCRLPQKQISFPIKIQQNNTIPTVQHFQNQFNHISKPKFQSFSKKTSQIKLKFRGQWKNDKRNIIPNLMNQLMSFLLKKTKSQKLIIKIFNHYPHQPSYSIKKFYLYIKKIKDSITHYLDQSILTRFFQIQDPNSQNYQVDEQQFYMRVCRIAIMQFLKTDVVLISLISNRMNQAKRKAFLIARQALLNMFLELAKVNKN